MVAQHLPVEDVPQGPVHDHRNRRRARAVEHLDGHLGGLPPVLLGIEVGRTGDAAAHAAKGGAIHGHGAGTRHPGDGVFQRVDVAVAVVVGIEQKDDGVAAGRGHGRRELVATQARGVHVAHAHVGEVLGGSSELCLVADARRGLVDDGGETRGIRVHVIRDLHDGAHVTLLEHARGVSAVGDAHRMGIVVDAEEHHRSRGEEIAMVGLHEGERLVIAADHGIVAAVRGEPLAQLAHPGVMGRAAEGRVMGVHVHDVDVHRGTAHDIEHAVAGKRGAGVGFVIGHDEQYVRGVVALGVLAGEFLRAREEA